MRSSALLLTLAFAAGCARTTSEPTAPLPDSAQKEAAPEAAAKTDAPPAGPASAAAAASPPAPPSALNAKAAAPGELDARFVPTILAAFRDYKAWGRVDDELRWAPWLCRMPMPGRPRMSAADDGDHARKLYSVFAKHQDRYPKSQRAALVSQPAGQVLIKESFHPEPVTDAPPQRHGNDNAPIEADHFDPYLREGSRVYRASHLAGVYVVMKLAKNEPGSDAGWIYGTVTPTGEVTSAGRVTSCMGCHVTAPHERVFGLNP
jgi:hypothetical protein